MVLLQLYDPELPTYVTTDASDYELGAVLTQRHSDQNEKVVAFASRTLSPAERKYSTVEHEVLACVWAVERQRTYLWGRCFVLCTEHQALTSLLTSKGSGRVGLTLARWSAHLLCFTYVMYHPGQQNVTADCLSRLPLTGSHEAADKPDMIAVVFSVPFLFQSSFRPVETAQNFHYYATRLIKVGPNAKKGLPDAMSFSHTFRYEMSCQFMIH